MGVIGRGGFYHAGPGGESGKQKLKKRKANWDTMKNMRDMKGKQKWGKQKAEIKRSQAQISAFCFPLSVFSFAPSVPFCGRSVFNPNAEVETRMRRFTGAAMNTPFTSCWPLVMLAAT
jgi:hypothetical protein